MTPIEKQILDTWFINHRTNLMLIKHLTVDALLLTTSPRGGGTVGHQLAHMYNVRYWKLERFNKALIADLTTIRATDLKTLSLLRDCHTLTASLVAEMLQSGIENNGRVKGFKRGVVPLLGYFIHHEAHHRGNILLTLKRCEFKLPNELKYGIWEWNKL
ncbi:DinB family protein [Robiginitalea sp. IMCC43444]|uniref:DinB family protein n=1 Tax=Robiginitalea sp. IMCC43444 TaxID=3459121 RepID=UPI00404161E9